MIKNLEKNIIEFEDNSILKIMLGVFHKNLEIIEKELNVTLFPRGNIISIDGEIKNILITKNTLSKLYERAKISEIIEKRDVESIIQNMKKNNSSKLSIKTPKKEIWPRTDGQTKLFKENESDKPAGGIKKSEIPEGKNPGQYSKLLIAININFILS